MGEIDGYDPQFRWSAKWQECYGNALKAGLPNGEAIDWADEQVRRKPPKPERQQELFAARGAK